MGGGGGRWGISKMTGGPLIGGGMKNDWGGGVHRVSGYPIPMVLEFPEFLEFLELFLVFLVLEMYLKKSTFSGLFWNCS